MQLPIPDLPQRFAISHPSEADFKGGGLREYSAYRDLGVAAATNGLAAAHVIRMTAPFRPQLSIKHHHDVQFQMVYCLKGWFETEFEGVGPATARPRFVLGPAAGYSPHGRGLVGRLRAARDPHASRSRNRQRPLTPAVLRKPRRV